MIDFVFLCFCVGVVLVSGFLSFLIGGAHVGVLSVFAEFGVLGSAYFWDLLFRLLVGRRNS